MTPPRPKKVDVLLRKIEVYQRQAEEVVVLAMSVPSPKTGQAISYDNMIPLIDELEASKEKATGYNLDDAEAVQIAQLKSQRNDLITKTENLRGAIRGFYQSRWTLLDPNPYEMLKNEWLEKLAVADARTFTVGGLQVTGKCLRGVRLMLADHYPRFRSSFAWGPSANACDGVVVFFKYDADDTLIGIQSFGGVRIPVDDTARPVILGAFSRGHGKHVTSTGTGYEIVAMRKAKQQARVALAAARRRVDNKQEAVPMWYVFLWA